MSESGGSIGSRARDPNLWRPVPRAELAQLRATWQCRVPWCRTWARGEACTTHVCAACGTPEGLTAPPPA